MSGEAGASGLMPPPGLYGADGQRMNVAPSAFSALFGGGRTNIPGPSNIDQNKLSAVPAYGADDMSDPLGLPMSQKPKMDPAMLQMMMAMRGMGGMGGQQSAMPMPQGMPAPQIQPGALMGAMPQMPQGGFRPRGMAGRF